MFQIIPSNDRYTADFGWLKTRWHFSFGDYYDPKNVNFGALRVFNDDIILGGGGFDTHGHRDMEIISYVLDGALEHRDSMKNGSVMRPGDVQAMSAGTGVTHSEFNASSTDVVHFLQIWLLPQQAGLTPSYEQKAFSPAEKQGRLRLVASPNGQDGSVTIHTDARLYAGRFDRGEEAKIELVAGRHAWVQVARGEVKVQGQLLRAGDGAALSEEALIHLEGVAESEVLLFDLA
jgi:redox-sensitive bicupin YhaK (pirin superfamily)